MQYFLKKAAEYVLSEYGSETSDIAIVFPGKRAVLYFNEYLTQISEKPIWSPTYFTITGLMERLSGYRVVEKLTLIFELFEAFKQVTGSSEEIDDFYFYAEMLLADIDDIDKYLVNAKDIFQNLANIKSIENQFDYLDNEQLKIIRRFWDSFRHGKGSEEKKSFITLWDAMPAIYEKFRNSLKDKGIAYEGLIYRNVAEDIAAQRILPVSYKKFLFIGFNALNKAEDKLFMYLKRNGKADFLWDYDHYYINNSIHEAGFFIRENLRKYPSPELGIKFESLTGNDKKITFVSVPSNTGQTGAVPLFIGENADTLKENPVKTAVVLADESLLLPVLAAIPESIADINVTMGFPFVHSGAYHLVNCIVNLHTNSKKSAGGNLRFYYKDVIALLGLAEINYSDPEKTAAIKKEIIESNIIYPGAEALEVTELLKKITGALPDARHIPQYFLDIFNELVKYTVIPEGEDSRNLWKSESFYIAIITLKRLRELIEGTQIELSSRIVFNLILKTLAGLTIPFSGEPLRGLQVMGLLETRALDFENIILLSMNEGIFPKTGNLPTFIPQSLRYGFGLPVPEHRDAIYAYYFYRLIQRAKNVMLVYNSRHDGLTTGERSRFLHQLYYDGVFKVTQKVIAADVALKLPKSITAVKDERVMKMLLRYAGEAPELYFTPSAVNTYLNCPLRFYFRYIAGLKETETVTEELDPALFGSVLHKAIELLYRPYVGKFLSSEMIEDIRKDKDVISETVNQAFSEEFFGNKKAEITGRNIILKEIIQKYLVQILETDKRYAPFRLTDLEKKLMIRIKLPDGKEVKIGGIIDRLDEKEGILRIVDYKSGEKKNSFENTDALFDETGSKRNGAVFQIFLYSLVLYKNEKRESILPGLYFIRSMFNPDFDFKINEQPGRNHKAPVENSVVYLVDFEKRLTGTLSQIFDANIPFTQTSDLEVCKNCPYVMICHRQ